MTCPFDEIHQPYHEAAQRGRRTLASSGRVVYTGFGLEAVIKEPDQIIAEFCKAMAGISGGEPSIGHDQWRAPHSSQCLPDRCCAVYVFSLTETHGNRCPAGPHRALKVGKAGLRSNARFQYQHYAPEAARSNLAASLLKSKVLWSFLGIQSLDPSNVGNWISTNTDRNNFYLDAEHAAVLSDLERYIRGLLGPVFEGS